MRIWFRFVMWLTDYFSVVAQLRRERDEARGVAVFFCDSRRDGDPQRRGWKEMALAQRDEIRRLSPPDKPFESDDESVAATVQAIARDEMDQKEKIVASWPT